MIRLGAVTFIIFIFISLFANGLNSKLDNIRADNLAFQHQVKQTLATYQFDTKFALADMNSNLINSLEFQLFQLTAFDTEEIECLATNLYHEARGQSNEGLIAVAHVTYNRVKDDRFPRTFCSVIKQANYHNQNGIMILSINYCQFSWYCDGKSDRINNPRVYEEIKQLARQFYIYRDYNVDFTEGSLFYHADYVSPSWSRTFIRVAQIGDHIFYKDDNDA